MAETFACASIYKNNKVDTFAVLEAVLLEPQRSHYLLVNKKMRKLSLLVIYSNDRVNDTSRHAHWLTKLNGKAELEVNFLLVCA